MIVATMFGGPRDGLVVAHNALTPLVFPITSAPVMDWMLDPDNNPEPMLRTITYFPCRETLQVCRCMPLWAHPVSIARSMDLTAITYTTHETCVYKPIGFR